MSTKIVVAAAFIVLFSLGLAFQGAATQTIIICAFSILLGFALPDIDRLFRPFWKYLRILVILMGAFLVAYAFLMAPTICHYFNFGGCTLLLPALVVLLLGFLIIFDFINPSKPPFHSLIAMAFSSLLYALLLVYLGYIEMSFLAAGAFAAAYTLHYFLETANVDRSKI